VPPGCLPGHIFLNQAYTCCTIPMSSPDPSILEPPPDGAVTPPEPSNHTQNRVTRLKALLSGRAAQEGYLAVIDQSIISISNFLATLILARTVSPTELGMYGVGFTSLRLVRSIQEGLTIQPLNTFGAAQELPEFRRYASSTSLIQVILAVLSAVSAAVLGWLLIRTGNDVAGPTIFALWHNFLWWQLQEYVRRVLYTRGAVRSAVINTLIANGVRLGLMFYWLSKDQLTGISGLNAIAWGSLVALIPGIWQTRSYWTAACDPILATFKKNWHFGKWIMGGVLANWVSVEFYPVLTAGMVSFAAAGAYRAIQNLVAPIHMLLRAIDTFLTPRAAKTYQAAGMPGVGRVLRLTYLLAGFPVLAILGIAVLFPRQILEFLYGSTYLEYSNGMVLMAIFYTLLFAYYPLQAAFKAIHLSRPIFIANGAAILVMFTLGIWTILEWGVYGTILGQILNALVVNAILWTTWIHVIRNSKRSDR
jgi:O-antigen/teichoic acid export membrane protein